MSSGSPDGRGAPRRLEHLDALRGAAALMVCLSHYGFTHGWYDWAITPLANAGVYVFFLISGYLIPRILSKEGYGPSRFGRYMAKRLLRLHPPYLAALLITFALSLLAARVKHDVQDWPVTDLLAQVFYLGVPGENPVFWTLQVEICYYVFLGATFTFLNSKVAAVRWIAFLLPCALWFMGLDLLFLKFVALFLCGIAFEQYQRGETDVKEFGLKLAVATTVVWLTAGGLGVAVSLATLVFIAWPPRLTWPRPVLGFGAISYSFYLLHYPIGLKFLNLTVARLPRVPPSLLAFCAFGLSVSAAWVLYRLVEQPAMRMSRLIASQPPRETVPVPTDFGRLG
jgi:peptidoglycan/LPS O-acetylase OafA/YrhL